MWLAIRVPEPDLNTLGPDDHLDTLTDVAVRHTVA
jgi:hypothetical protein